MHAVTPLGEALLNLEPARPLEGGDWDPAPGRASRRAIRGLVTATLVDVWEDATRGTSIGPLALCLVGSFARAEGGPTSDIDLVLLHDLPRRLEGRVQDLARNVLHPLWDQGVSVDHAVRTPSQCRQVAADDLPALTGLLDLRVVAGSKELTESVRRAVGSDLRRAAPTRVEELLAGARDRWSRDGDLDRVNEPDLKSCHGGLRDLDLMRALAATWLTDYPHDRVQQAAELLFDVRDSLQRVTRRHTAKLLRAHQGPVAADLGLTGPDAEADLMRLVARAGGEIAAATHDCVERALGAREAWGGGGLRRRVRHPHAPRRGRRSLGESGPELERLGPGIAVSDGALVFTEAALARDPSAVLELAGTSSRTGLPPSAATLADIGSGVRQGSLASPWTSRQARLLVDFLGTGEGVIPTWFALDRAGVPAAWIPEWEALRSRPQRAEFHRWTVDRHCVGTVAEMGVMLDGRADWLPPFDPGIIDRPTALLAALLHDIGKRPPDGGAGHPHDGAVLVPGILERLGLERLAPAVATVVEHHLDLALAATSRDPQDPATVSVVLDAVGHDRTVLATLIALTRADSVAAGDKAWNPWRASLVNTLARTCWETLAGS